jgi:Cyclin, N-terminal domain/Cyclin, C-terminal domain
MAFNRVSSFGSTDSGYESGTAVEVFDTQTRLKQQEHAREVARRQQQLLASELSRLDSDEYAQDMLEHMLRMDVRRHMTPGSIYTANIVQSETMPDVDSIDIQTEIQWFMRPFLLDFLVEAHSAFQLLPETLFLTINLLDRYCSKRVVYKRHYQLVGCAALLIAAKYGDKKEKVPTIKELRSMCRKLYDDDMFLQMEWHVLSTLGWAIGHPTADIFVKMAIKDSIYDPEAENLALYILEIALYHRDFVSKQSSSLALAALALARHILGRPQARPTEWAHGFCNNLFLDLSQKLHEPSVIVSRKYASARYCSVSTILENFLRQKAMMAQRAPLTPSYELTPPSAISKGSNGNYFGSFATPPKTQFPAVMQHGLYTPPITPEEDGKGMFSGLNNVAPPTPTPNATQFQFTGLSQYSSAAPRWTFEPY